MHNATGAIVLDLNAKHPMQFSEVSDLEVLVQPGLELFDEVDGGGNDGAIIHMYNNNSELTLVHDNMEVHSLVYSTLLEPKGEKDTGELLVPAAA